MIHYEHINCGAIKKDVCMKLVYHYCKFTLQQWKVGDGWLGHIHSLGNVSKAKYAVPASRCSTYAFAKHSRTSHKDGGCAGRRVLYYFYAVTFLNFVRVRPECEP